MNSATRTTVHHNIADLNQVDRITEQGVHRGDVIMITIDNDGNPQIPPRRYLFDGRRLVDLTDLTDDLPTPFEVPGDFPPHYWREALPGIKKIPGRPWLPERVTEIYVGRDDQEDEYLIVPFLNVEDRDQATEDNVYYIVYRIGVEAFEPDEEEEMVKIEEARGLAEALSEDHDHNLRFDRTDQDIGGIPADRILILRL